MARQGAALLCIDDDPACLRLRKTVLENFGYQVWTSRSGREGLELLHSRSFDAVLVDYQMPGMNGVQVASEIRRLKPHIPILMLSAYSSLPQSVTRFVNSFVSKTEPTSYLVAKIEQLLALTPQSGDPFWLLGAAVVTTAVLGFFAQKMALHLRRNHEQPAMGLSDSA